MHPTSLTRRLILFGAFIFCALMVPSAYGQTPTPTPSVEELQLQEQKRILELQKDIELAKKAIRDAQPETPAPPTPTTTALAGDTTAENVKLESEMVSYKAMSKAAEIISRELKDAVEGGTKLAAHSKDKGDKHAAVPSIAIFDGQVVKDWRFYQALFPAFDGQVKDILNRYVKLLCPNPDVNPEFKAKFCKAGNEARDFSPTMDLFNAERDLHSQLIETALPTAFGAGTNLLKSFIDLTALFRTDTKITGNTLSIEESALVAELFRSLKNKFPAGENNTPGINLYYPEVFPPRVPVPSDAPGQERYSRTVTTIGTLFLAKTEADRLIEGLNKKKQIPIKALEAPTERVAKLQADLSKVIALTADRNNLIRALAAEVDPIVRKRINAEIADVKTALAKLPIREVLEGQIEVEEKGMEAPTAQIKQITDQVKSLNDSNDRFKTFVDEFVKVGTNGVNALALFIKAEDIEDVMRDDRSSFWLEIKSVAAGGNNRVRKNLLRYFSGAKLDHSGGVIVEYTLYDKTGAVVYSDKLSVYEGYVEPKKITGLQDTVNP